MTIETTRRTVLPATPFFAAAIATNGMAMSFVGTPEATAGNSERSEWDATMARWQEAYRVYARYRDTVWDPAFEQERAFERAHGVEFYAPGWIHKRDKLVEQFGNYRMADEINDRIEQLSEVADTLHGELMYMPAPDLAALRWKLDYLLELEHTDDADGGSISPWTAKFMRQPLADIARLLPQGR